MIIIYKKEEAYKYKYNKVWVACYWMVLNPPRPRSGLASALVGLG